MARSLLLCLLLTLLAASILAQESKPSFKASEYTDVVLFKTGGKIVGKIVKIEEGKNVIIEREDGFRFDVDWKDLDLITTVDEDISDRQQELMIEHKKEPSRMSPHGHAHWSLSEAVYGFGFDVRGGWEVWPGVALAAGAGWHMMKNIDGGYLPFSVNARWMPTNDRVAPYMSLEFSYGFCWIEGDRLSDYDYTCLGFAFGAMSTMIDKTAITLEAGVDFYKFDDPVGGSHDPSCIRFTLGLDF